MENNRVNQIWSDRSLMSSGVQAEGNSRASGRSNDLMSVLFLQADKADAQSENEQHGE